MRLLWIILFFTTALQARDLDVLLVVGAAGTEEYGKKFETQAEAWKTACATRSRCLPRCAPPGRRTCR